MKVPVPWTSGAFTVRYLSQTAASYVGVDRHARTPHVCVLDQAGTVRLSRNLPARPEPLLAAVAPFRPDLPSAASASTPGTSWPTPAAAR